MASQIKYSPLEEEHTDDIHRAIFDGSTKPLIKLLQDTNHCWNPNVVDKNGWTYLMHACWLHRESFVKLLLACHADVNLTRCETGVTALHLAFARRDAGLAARLLQNGAEAQALMTIPASHVQTQLAVDESEAQRPVETQEPLVVKPHDFQSQAFTAEVVAEYRSLQVEEPQLKHQKTWKYQDGMSFPGLHSHDGDHKYVMFPAPPEPKGVWVGTTDAMKDLLEMPAPDIAPLGVDVGKLSQGGILRPPPLPK